MGVETSWDSRQVQIAAFTIKVFGLVSYTFVSGSKHHTMTLRPLVGFLKIPNFHLHKKSPTFPMKDAYFIL